MVAAVGKAFVSRLRGKGFSVEKTTKFPLPLKMNGMKSWACVWDDNILGYLKVKMERNSDGTLFYPR